MIKTNSEIQRKSTCEACNGSQLCFWLDKAGVEFVRCATCQMGARRKLPLPEDLFQIYEGFAREYYLREKKMWLDESLDHSDRLREIRPYRKEGRLLDVGCSTGGFSKVALQDGWEPFGVDLSPTVAEHCRKEGLNVFAGTLVGAGYPNEFFDVVRFWASLEHVTDPFLCLAESHRILRKGGLLLFSVPSIESLTILLLGKKYRYVCPEHLYYYSRKSIEHLLRRAGYGNFRMVSKEFDVFTFLEDWKGKIPDTTAKTREREIRFVQEAKRNWYHRPLKGAYRACLKLLEWVDWGDNWFVYAEK